MTTATETDSNIESDKGEKETYPADLFNRIVLSRFFIRY